MPLDDEMTSGELVGAEMTRALNRMHDPEAEGIDLAVLAYFDGTDANVMTEGWGYSDEQPRSGSYSLKADVTSNLKKLYGRVLEPVVPGQDYYFEVYNSVSNVALANGFMRLGMEWQDAAKESLGVDTQGTSIETTLEVGTDYIPNFIYGQAPAGAAYVRPYLRTFNFSGAEFWYVDSLFFTESQPGGIIRRDARMTLKRLTVTEEIRAAVIRGIPSGDLEPPVEIQGALITGSEIDANNNTIANIGANEVKPGLIADQAAEGTADDADYIFILDVSTGLLKKMLRSVFHSGLQASLGFTPENVANKDTDTSLAANSDTRYASQKAVKAYIDGLLAAADAVVYKGVVNCSANPNYPAADAGHLYMVSVAGKIGGASGTTVEAGDMFICKVDSTAAGNQATVGANWNVIQTNITYTPEDVANKDTDGTLAANSDTKYASQKATKTYVDGGLATKQASLGYTAENTANKDTDGTLAANSDTKYASQKAVKTYADTKQTALGFTAENSANKDTDGTLAANSDTKYASQKATKTYASNASNLSGGTVPPARLTGLGARVYNSTAISISNNTTTALTFNSERDDSDSMHSTVTNTNRLTIATAGWYMIAGNVEFDANATGNRSCGIRLNGSTVIAQNFIAAAGGSQPTRIGVSTIYKLAAGDYLELVVFQSSGGALNVAVTGNVSPEFSAVWAGS